MVRRIPTEKMRSHRAKNTIRTRHTKGVDEGRWQQCNSIDAIDAIEEDEGKDGLLL
jgi:hypothetical protein